MKLNLRFFVFSVFVALTFLSVPQKIWGVDDSYDIVEKIFDSNTAYSIGIFEPYKDKDGVTFSTESHKPQKERTQAVLNYDKDPIPEREKVLQKAVPGHDGRERILNTTDWPYSIHAHLDMLFNEDTFCGSGVIVGPHHLLTCGHNVYDFDRKIFSKEILVYPALNGKVAPFNKVKATRAYIFKCWQNQGCQQFDMALLLLDQPIGDYVGWGGLLNTADTDLAQEKVHITGYPGDKGCKQMWSMGHKIKTVKPEVFDYEIDTYAGQSGSAVWINKWGTPMILGVHTLGSNAINSGVRLSTKKFKELSKLISDTYILNPNVDSLDLASRMKLNPSLDLKAKLIAINDIRSTKIDDLIDLYKDHDTEHDEIKLRRLCDIFIEINDKVARYDMEGLDFKARRLAIDNLHEIQSSIEGHTTVTDEAYAARMRYLDELESTYPFIFIPVKAVKFFVSLTWWDNATKHSNSLIQRTTMIQRTIAQEIKTSMEMYQEFNGTPHPRWDECLKM
jgi:V8-like Glu-specific endopeptidase